MPPVANRRAFAALAVELFSTALLLVKRCVCVCTCVCELALLTSDVFVLADTLEVWAQEEVREAVKEVVTTKLFKLRSNLTMCALLQSAT